MKKQGGFTLIELMITVAIVAILATIAYPSYVSSITKSKRRAAEACLSNYAQYMERYYTANMRYDENAAGTATNTLPVTDCAAAQNTGGDYTYTIVAASLARSTYTLSAAPKTGSAQASRDTACGTLTINQVGTRGAAGSTDADAVQQCW